MKKYIVIILLIIITGDCKSQNKISNDYYYDSTDKINKNTNSVDTNSIDVKLFRAVNNSRSKFKDAVVPVIDQTMLLSSLILPPSLFLYGRAKQDNYLENTGFLLALSEVTNSVLTFSIKIMVNRPRPYMSLKNVYHKEIAKIDRYSFPSGHTSTVFCITTMITLRYPQYPQIYVPLYIWSLAVGYGRMYLGMHYPTDLLGGAVVGTLSSVLIYSIRKDIFNLKNRLFSEDKDDVSKSTNYLSTFLGVFIVNELINEFIFSKSNKLKLRTSADYTENNTIRYNLALNF